MARFPEHEGIANGLLLALPAATLKRLRPALKYLNTTRGQVIDRRDAPVRHLYFVNRGLVSMVKTMRDGRTVEITAIGIEGATDPHALFGIEAAVLETVVQIPGTAFRIRRDTLRDEMAKDAALREMMQNYTHFSFNQLAQTAACNRLHSLEERCCRWLLIAHDSALSDTFPLTHEFLAMMLGVQRAGVSIAASFLKRAGLIRYTQGRITITDRAGLEDAACECYGSIQALRDQLFQGHGKRRKPANSA